MKNKLFNILNTLSIVELNRFKKFVDSPYFNVNKDLIKLYSAYFNEIRRNKKKLKVFNKESVWNEIYPNLKYNDKNYRKLNSLLLKLLESYFAQEAYESNPLNKANFLLQSVGKKHIEPLYNSSFTHAKRLSEIQYQKSAEHYYYLYQFEKSFLTFSKSDEIQKKIRKSNTFDFFDIEKQSNYLDYYYVASKLRHLCTVLSRSKVYMKDHRILFIDDILKNLEQIDISEYPPIAVYYQIYLSTIEPEKTDHYYKLKELVFEHIDKFPPDIVQEVYDATLNYCIRKINTNDSFHEETLNTYLYGLEQGYILKEGSITPTSFRNICSVGFKMANYEWVLNFINEYQSYLKEENRFNAVTYNMGRYYFHIKDYKSVIRKLRDVSYDDYLYELISKNTLIMTYYEINEFDILDSFLNSFSKFIHRHKKIPDQRRQRYQNLIKIVKKMISIIPGDNKEINKMLDDISKMKNIVNKNWIIEKIEELKK